VGAERDDSQVLACLGCQAGKVHLVVRSNSLVAVILPGVSVRTRGGNGEDRSLASNRTVHIVLFINDNSDQIDGRSVTAGDDDHLKVQDDGEMGIEGTYTFP